MAYGGANEAWIVGAVRTPIGRHGGSLSAVRPDDLGAIALAGLMERAGVPAEEVEDVYFGCANQAGEDNRNVGRMSLLLAGFPDSVGGATVNRLCGSGLEAVAGAARAVMLGEADVYVGGGVESMSRAPWVMQKPERAFPTGNATMFDTTLGWRMINPKMEEMGYTDTLGMTAENLAQERFLVTPDEDDPEGLAEDYDISREAQDRFALKSHEKAIAAMDEKKFRDEIVPVTVKGRKGAEWRALTDQRGDPPRSRTGPRHRHLADEWSGRTASRLLRGVPSGLRPPAGARGHGAAADGCPDGPLRSRCGRTAGHG